MEEVAGVKVKPIQSFLQERSVSLRYGMLTSVNCVDKASDLSSGGQEKVDACEQLTKHQSLGAISLDKGPSVPEFTLIAR